MRRGVLRVMQGGYVSFHCSGCDMAHVIKVEGEHAWTFNNNYDRPTFTPSILVQRSANPEAKEEFKEYQTALVCHSFITDGNIQFLGDCTHKLANSTVALEAGPDWEEV